MAIIQKQLTATVSQPVGVSVDFLWEITSNPNGCATIISGSINGVNTPPYQVSVIVAYDDATCITANATCTLTESDKSTTGICEQVINFNLLVDETLYVPCETNNAGCYLTNSVNEVRTFTINMTGQADGDYYIDFFNYHQSFESYVTSYVIPVKYTLKQNGTTLVETPYVLRNGSRYQTELGTNAIVGFWQNAVNGTFTSPYIYTYGAYPSESTPFMIGNYTIAPCNGFTCTSPCSLIPIGLCNAPDPFTGDVNNYCYQNAGRINYTFDNNNGLLLELIVTPYSEQPSIEFPLNLIKAYCSAEACCEDDITITGPYDDNCYVITADTGHIYINGDYDTDINGDEICITCNGIMDLMFVIDISGSLGGGTNTYRQDISLLYEQLNITETPSITDPILAGSIAFAGSIASISLPPQPMQSSLSDLQYYIENVTNTNQTTCPLAELHYAWDQLQINIPDRNAPKAIVFISDGIMTSCAPLSVLNLISDIRNSGIAVIGIKINNEYNSNFNCPGNFAGLNNSIICNPGFQPNHIIPVFSDSFASELPNITATITALFGMSNYIVYECEPGCTTLYNLPCLDCIVNPPVLTITDGTCNDIGNIVVLTECDNSTIEWEVDSGSGFVSVGSTTPTWVEGNIYRAKCVADDCESTYSNQVEAINSGCTVELVNATFTDSKLIFSDLNINGLSASLTGWTIYVVNSDDYPDSTCTKESIPNATAIIYHSAGYCALIPSVPYGVNLYNFDAPGDFFVPLIPGNYRLYLSCANEQECICCYTDITITCADCIINDSFNSGSFTEAGTYENIYQFCIPCSNECFKIKFNAGGTVGDTITISTDPTFTTNILLETTSAKTRWYTIDLNNNSSLNYYEDGNTCTGEKDIYIKIESSYSILVPTTWEISTECCVCNDECPSEDTFFPCVTDSELNVNGTITITLKDIDTNIIEEGLDYDTTCKDCISTCNDFIQLSNNNLDDVCQNISVGIVNNCSHSLCSTHLNYPYGTLCPNNNGKLQTIDDFTVVANSLTNSYTFSFNNNTDATNFYNWIDNIMTTENTTFCPGSGDKANSISIGVFDGCGDGSSELYLTLFSNFYDSVLLTVVPTLTYSPVTLIGSVYTVKLVHLAPLPNTCLYGINNINSTFTNAKGFFTGSSLQKVTKTTSLYTYSYWGLFSNECKMGYLIQLGITEEDNKDSWYAAIYNNGCGLTEVCGTSYLNTYLVLQYGPDFVLPSGWILHPNATTALNDCFSCP